MFSVREVWGEADALHQGLFEASKWTPATTAGDRQVVPQVNLLSDLDETQLKVKCNLVRELSERALTARSSKEH
jgi:hypothetical protein